MLSGIWDSMKGAAVESWRPMSNAYDSVFKEEESDLGRLYGDVDFDDPANDELLGVISDTEQEIADSKTDFDWSKIAEGLSAAASTSGRSAQMQGGGGGGPRGGGTNIKVEDQYAAAMKALVDKYGKFMFNQNF